LFLQTFIQIFYLLFEAFLLVKKTAHLFVVLKVTVAHESEVDIEHKVLVAVHGLVNFFESVRIQLEDVLAPGPVDRTQLFVLVQIRLLLNDDGEVRRVELVKRDGRCDGVLERFHGEQAEPEEEANHKVKDYHDDCDLLL